VLDEIITALEPEEQYRDMLSWCARQYRDELSQAQLERITCIAGARSDPKQRFDTLAALLPRRSDGHRADALIELLRTARDIDAFSDRRDRLQQIAPGLAALPRERLVQLWHERISELSAQRREHLLADLAGLAPIVAALGGPAAMQGAARAVLQVGAWWP
jgi:hypothetical protein